MFLDLLLGRQQPEDQAAGGKIQLRIDLETLAQLNDHPGDIPGWGPVLADIARQIAQPATTWDVVITDPTTGRAVWSGITRRRPTTGQRRNIQARNPSCVFPGCRIPATDCDLDHRVRHTDGGPTTDWNQNPLCRHDHPTKDHLWQLHRLPNGDYHWTSPLHHTYTPGNPHRQRDTNFPAHSVELTQHSASRDCPPSTRPQTGRRRPRRSIRMERCPPSHTELGRSIDTYAQWM